MKIRAQDMLLDIATEELSHLEVIGSIVAMLNKGVKAKLSEGAMKEAELYMELGQGNGSHTTSLLYGGGAPLTNSAGVPWTAAYIDSITDPACDLRSNIAAESRAKNVYERLINVTDDAGIKDALTFLMTREIAHQKSFERALYAIEPNFPPGKLPGDPASPTSISNSPRAKAKSKGRGTRATRGSASRTRKTPWRSTAATAARRSSSARETRRRKPR